MKGELCLLESVPLTVEKWVFQMSPQNRGGVEGSGQVRKDGSW
jgi:hypothetical protein